MVEQPYALLMEIAALLDYARDYRKYSEMGDQAPGAKARVLAMARRSAAWRH